MKVFLLTIGLLLIETSVSIGQDFDQLIQNKQFAKAEQMFENANAIDRPIYQAKLGDAYLNNNNLEEAAYHYLQLMDKERLKKLGFKYHEKNDFYAALKYFQLTDKYSFGLLSLAEHYIKKTMADSARKYTLKYYEVEKVKNNEFHAMVKDIVFIYVDKGRFNKAIEFAIDYAYAPTKGLLAEALLDAKLFEEAFELRSFTKNNTKFNNQLGNLLLASNKVDLALACYISADNLTKQNECYLQIARSNLRKGAVKDAKEYYEKAFAGELMNKEIGDYFFKRKEYELANPYYIKLPPNPKYAEIFRHMAIHSKAINNYASASIYLKKSGQIKAAEEIGKKVFINNDNGTISSAEFPFLWQQRHSGPMDLNSAIKYCEKLNLAGYSDWSLPDNIALTSISPDHNRSESIINQYFPNSTGKSFWSRTKFKGDSKSEKYFTISITKENKQEVKASSESFYVRCYRPFNNTLQK